MVVLSLRRDGPVAPETRGEIQKEAKKEKTKSLERKLENIVNTPDDTLLHIKTIFPFDLFPGEITISPTIIRITTREFFGSESVQTLPIQDIAYISSEVSPFLSCLKIVDKKDTFHPILIKSLRKKDAEKAQRIISGLLVKEVQEDKEARVIKTS